MSLTHPLDTQLRDLWAKRSSLDQKGWEQLYDIVMRVLTPFRPKELAGLPEDNAVYMQEFFEDKVFRLDSLTTCKHVGALKIYYQRFLRDRLDSQKRKDGLEVADFSEEGDPPSSIAERSKDQFRAEEDDWNELKESGLSITQIRASAGKWLRGAEPWVPAYLALHFCPDPELSEPLCKLAKRLNIKSYHHKAVQLGINWAAGKAGSSGIKFEDTLIGQWVVQGLRLEVKPDSSRMIHAALKILCHESLIWAEQQEAGS